MDIKFPDSLALALLEKFTDIGGSVLDPFAGLGTTFFACEQTGRVPYGFETDRQRYEWVVERIQSKENLYCSDAGDLASVNLPKIDFSITSPPYMPYWHTWNPLHNGDPQFDGYDTYLARLQEIYRQIRTVMKRDAYLIVQADNLSDERFSPLLWDIGAALSEVVNLEGEILVTWSENLENDSRFTQCLVFKNTEP